MTTRRILLLLVVTALGCGGSNNNGGGQDMAQAPFPAPPAIGMTQLDRMGRAAVNTALTDPFYTSKTAHEAQLDAYNKAPRAMWPSFAPQFAAALGIYDGLDGICDNQPLAMVGAADGGAAGEYGTLASILADDELLLDTTVAGCDPSKNYLAVEVAVITSGKPASCGGRTPLDNAIDTTYAALSGGLISQVAVVNGVTADADTANQAQLTMFPFLGAPL
jgi:hypothetical protein